MGQKERCQEERPGASGPRGRELSASPQGRADRQPRHARGHLRLMLPHRCLLSCLLLTRLPCVSILPTLPTGSPTHTPPCTPLSTS
uniref:DET1 and DDB1 associated 1 n=1 Tax=Myotis myotis TaxID=51298 RepID=A0A7J7RBT5_MYOMY|nr:DET1 and DDB1 associated 1 [Myotis myotis]